MNTLHDTQDVQLDIFGSGTPVEEMPAPIGSFVQVGDREWHELDADGAYVRTHLTTRKPSHPSGSPAENGVDEHGEILPNLPPGSYDPATVDMGF